MIFIDNRQDKIKFSSEDEKIMRDIIDYALREEGVTVDYEVSVILIDNDEIKRINAEMRDIHRVTDVLSFPMLEYPEGRVYSQVFGENKFDEIFLDNGNLILGDIALSLERAKKQSIEFNHSFIRECIYLTVHSVLHLMGYDHILDKDKLVMRRREEEILNKFNINR
ncbi:rRNA maturation RNase YbeY [Clostridium pasteurianum]|uniref:rRNA maturation RNase YbeY n=1 Tax=Clostridium pasteurianum TaxID=1501 RepID=UPI002260D07E|nr:rRNA maturation RNase YbeY [Clostridium pasteurianum]UZW12637.1 rRNA maturation RNase YbeY [Clostridium pasteurianum]